MTNTISGLVTGETIDFADIPFDAQDTATYDSTVDKLKIRNGSGTILAKLKLIDKGYVSNSFVLSPDAGSGTDITTTVTGSLARTAAVVQAAVQTITVSSGQISSGVTLNSGDTMTVLAGGIARGTVVNSGGSATVTSSGTANGTLVNGGGLVVVVGSSGMAIATVLSGNASAEAIEIVSSSGVALRTVVSSGGTLLTEAHGKASGTVVTRGGLAEVESRGHNVSTTIEDGGSETISAGGFSLSTVVSSAGLQSVFSGGMAEGTIVSSAGLQSVFSGGTAEATIVSNGGQMRVSSGGFAINAQVTSGGKEVVSSGVASGTRVLSGGQETVLKGGLAKTDFVSSGGRETVSRGGVVNNIFVSNGGTVVDHGRVAVSFGGKDVFSGILMGDGVLANTGAGSLVLRGDASAFSGTETIARGTLELASAGAAGSGIIRFAASGATLEIDSKAMPANTIESFITGETIDLAGIAFNSADSATYNGTTLSIENGGTVLAQLTLTGEAYASNSFVLSPDAGSGTDITTTVTGALARTAAVMQTTVKSIDVGSGVTSSGITLNSGDTMTVLAGGTADATTVSSGGYLADYGATRGTALFGREDVYGAASGTAIKSGGFQLLSTGILSNGTTHGTVVSSGGTESIEGHGAALGTVVSSGGLVVLAVGEAKNSVIKQGGTVIADRDSSLNFAGSRNQAIAGTLSGSGRLVVSGTGTVKLRGIASGYSGAESISGGTLELASAGAAGIGKIVFRGNGTALKIDGSAMPSNTISGFVAGDTIDLARIGFSSNASAVYNSSFLEIENGGTVLAELLLLGEPYASNSFALSSDAGSGTDITTNVAGVLARAAAVMQPAVQTITVSSGQTSSGITLNSGDTMTVLKGGTANATIVNLGAVVFDAGNVSATRVFSGGQLQVSSGGHASATHIRSDGLLIDSGDTGRTNVYRGGLEEVLSGAVASLGIVSSGGVEIAFGTTSESRIYSGGREEVSSGGVASRSVVRSDGVLIDRGTTKLTLLLSGREKVLSGGVANGTLVFSGGAQYVSSGGTASGTAVSSGGVQYVSSGGVVIGAHLSGGVEEIFAGGTANSVVVRDSGEQIVHRHGSAAGTLVTLSATQVVEGTAIGTVLSFGGTQVVSDGGLAQGTMIGVAAQGGVPGLGEQIVASGGIASGAAVGADGDQRVSSGGLAISATLAGKKDGVANQEVWGVASDTSVGFRGFQEVFSGGAAVGTVLQGVVEVSNGFTFGWGIGVVDNGGVASDTVVNSGGLFDVASGGVADHPVVNSGGTLQEAPGSVIIDPVIEPGGTVIDLPAFAAISASDLSELAGNSNDTTPDSSNNVEIGTLVTAPTLMPAAPHMDGSFLAVNHGGTVAGSGGQTFSSFTTISVVSAGQTVDLGKFDGGFLTIDNGGTGIFRVMGGGFVSAFGVASGGMIGGGFISALDGGAADHWTMNGGIIDVLAGGLASHTVLKGGGIVDVFTGGVANRTVISNGIQDLGFSSGIGGGIAVSTTIGSAGFQDVFTGGIARTTVVKGGAQIVSSGGVASNTTISGTSTGSSGTQDVSAGGVASHAVVKSGGSQVVLSGGVAVNAVASSGGIETVASGGVAKNTTVSSGGVQDVFAGGIASHAVVKAGSQVVFSGGVALNAVVSSGGEEIVSAGGIVKNGLVKAGGIVVDSGTLVFGKTGKTVFAGTLSGGGRLTETGGGTLVLHGNASAFSGTETISNGTLELTNAHAAGGGTLHFKGAGDMLRIDGKGMPANRIESFIAGDTIDLAGIVFNSHDKATYSGTTLTVQSGSTVLATLTLTGESYASNSFALSPDAGSGTKITTAIAGAAVGADTIPAAIATIGVASQPSVARTFDAAGGNSTLQGGAVFPLLSEANPDRAWTPAQAAGGPATAPDFGVVSAPGIPAAGATSHDGANVISAGILIHTSILAV